MSERPGERRPDPGRRGFDEAVSEVIRSLGPGEVVTYGEVAAEAGYPGAARAVGRLLATTDRNLPWWRVVTATGRLVPGHEATHTARLRAEGVAVVDGRVAPVGTASPDAAPDAAPRRRRNGARRSTPGGPVTGHTGR